MIKRIIVDIFLIFAVFGLPWYVAVCLNVIFIIFFKKFWEGLIVAIIFDFLYSIPASGIYAKFGIFTLFFGVLIIITEKIKSNLRI